MPDAVPKRKLKYLNSSWSWRTKSRDTIKMIQLCHITGLARSFVGGHDFGWLWSMLLCKAKFAYTSVVCGAIKQIHCLDKNETINFYDPTTLQLSQSMADVWRYNFSHFSSAIHVLFLRLQNISIKIIVSSSVVCFISGCTG